MGNWIPNDPTLVAQILKISASYSPPPPEGFISPMTWGIEGNVISDFLAREFQRKTCRPSGTLIPSTIPVPHRSSLMHSENTTGQP